MTTEDQRAAKDIAHFNPRDNWVLVQRQCKAFLDSGFLPTQIKTIAQAVTIAWKGHELGLPPLQAFASITVINGKPALSAELMLALIYQRVKGAKVTFKTPPDKQHLECRVEMQRPGGEPQLFGFSMEDAKRAGLIGKAGGAWEKYPAAMLRARAISAGARAVFPDAIMGCYTPEELGVDIIDAEFTVSASVPQTPAEDLTSPPPEQKTVHPQADYPKSNPNWENEPCTEAQRKKLWAMAKTAGFDEDHLTDFLQSSMGVESSKNLTKGQIQKLFAELERTNNPSAR